MTVCQCYHFNIISTAQEENKVISYNIYSSRACTPVSNKQFLKVTECAQIFTSINMSVPFNSLKAKLCDRTANCFIYATPHNSCWFRRVNCCSLKSTASWHGGSCL